jgi:molybdopterin-guanine dinucleotide biosynthesis protein A
MALFNADHPWPARWVILSNSAKATATICPITWSYLFFAGCGTILGGWQEPIYPGEGDVSSEKITGVILAGGLGRRMGGTDKGLQEFNGQPMVAQVVARFAPQVDELLINANQNAARYEAFGYRVVADAITGFAGPLAGLHAALSAATSPLVATAPCDSPFLPLDLVARLQSALVESGAQFAVARTFAQAHPVFCLCRRELLPHLADYLARGERRFEGWYATLAVVDVAFDDEAAAFENINTRKDLARLSLKPEGIDAARR